MWLLRRQGFLLGCRREDSEYAVAGVPSVESEGILLWGDLFRMIPVEQSLQETAKLSEALSLEV